MRTYKLFVFVGFFLSIFVIGLGAFTRLTDSGLGCPIGLDATEKFLCLTPQKRPLTVPKPLVQFKAWAEMVHRYAAGSLATIIFLIAILGWRLKISDRQQRFLISALVLLVVFKLFWECGRLPGASSGGGCFASLGGMFIAATLGLLFKKVYFPSIKLSEASAFRHHAP